MSNIANLKPTSSHGQIGTDGTHSQGKQAASEAADDGACGTRYPTAGGPGSFGCNLQAIMKTLSIN